MSTPDATWAPPRHLLADFPAGGDPVATAAEWADRLLAASPLPGDEPWPAVILVVSPPREPALRTGVALALARHLAGTGRRVVVLEGDDRWSGMTAWLGREGREGWIDVVRHGISPATAGVVLDGSEGRVLLLGVGSYAPVRLEDAEIPPLLERLREDADHVIVTLSAGDLALPWLAIAESGIVHCPDRTGDGAWTPPQAPRLTVTPVNADAEASVALPGMGNGLPTPGGPPRGSSPVFRRLAVLLAVLLAVSAAWWLLVLRQGSGPGGELAAPPAVVGPAGPGSTGTTVGAGTVAVTTTPAETLATDTTSTATPAVAEETTTPGAGVTGAATSAPADTAVDPFTLPVGRDGYCLHVESVSDSLGAERALAELARRYGIHGTIRRALVNGRRWWRIYTGSFGSLAEARAWSDSLKRRLHTDYALPVSSRHLR